MDVTPDAIIYWQWGALKLNATILFTWLIMVVLTVGSYLITRTMTVSGPFSRRQMFLETIVSLIRDEIRDIAQHDPKSYLPFIGTLFLFISVANFLAFVPGYTPPTGSISTTAGLALCVFFAVPGYGVARAGWKAYLRHYIQPSAFMLPFHLIGEFSRTLALAVRLFGNIMSGTLIVAILLSVTPLFLPVAMEILGLLIGQIQAYIFAVLAMVYIASAARTRDKPSKETSSEGEENG